MIVGHIGVRKGSKGVVGKNFRDFLGKPLIDWSLDGTLLIGAAPGLVALGLVLMALPPAASAPETASAQES